MAAGKNVSAVYEASAFDAIAEEYDRIFTDSVIGRAQRSLVHAALRDRFYSGQRVLEFNCGTGEDAIYLASLGVSVVACDISSRMIRVASRKVRARKAAMPVTLVVCANEHLDLLRDRGLFDGALSNFGGLNCVTDLAGVAQAMEKLIRPGGQLFLCFVGRFCLWEILWYCARGKWSKAFRRFKRDGHTASIGGRSLRVFYPSAPEVRAAFSPAFRLESWRGIGVLLPPSWMEPFFRNRPGLVGWLTRIDAWLGDLWMFRGTADHVLFRFVRESQ